MNNVIGMDTLNRIILAAIISVAAVSCSEKVENNSLGESPAPMVSMTLRVSQDSLTRVSMDGLSLLWDASDKIAVCSMDSEGNRVNAQNSGGAHGILNSSEYVPSTSADFEINLPAGLTPLAVAYPYFASMSSEGEGELLACNFTIPEVQTAVKDDIPTGSFALVGAFDGTECHLHNACAVIRFDIVSSDIASLEFRGNNGEYVAGRKYCYAKSGEVSRKTYSSSKTLILKPSGEVFDPGTYYFCVWPNDFTQGFTISLTNKDGLTSERSSGAFVVKRNKKYVGFGSENGWFRKVVTGVAGQLGTAGGNTATLYGIAPDDKAETDEVGFQISTDGKEWIKLEGSSVNRFSTDPLINVFTMTATDLTPDTPYYYRAYCKSADGVTSFGGVKNFSTVANAESAILDLYNGYDTNYWPITNLELGNGINKGSSANAVSKGKELAITTKSGHTFSTKNTNGVWINSATGALTMGKADGDYINFPKISGKKPVFVSVVVGNVANNADPNHGNNNFGRPSIRKIGSVTDATGGAPWNPLPLSINDIHSWQLSGTDDSQYQMYFNHASNRYIRYLEVVYQTL